MRKIFLLLTLALLLTFGMIAASAQDDDNPLLRMLARIPDTPAARTWLTYADYQALISARPGAPSIGSWDEFVRLNDQRTDESGFFISALMSIQSGPQFYTTNFMQGSEMADVVGFDLFEIERAAEYGEPPAQVTLLEGDFNAEAVRSAHEARDYTQTQMGDLSLLCPATGCDNGNQYEIANRILSNPFGGELGRSQPVLVGDQLIASSPDDQALNGVALAIAGDQNTLADDADYRAAVEAISANGTVLQAYFINPADVASLSAGIIPRLTQEQIDALREELEGDFAPLPQYNLLALADTVIGDEQQALVALVFSNSAAAEAAAALFPERLNHYISLAVNQPFEDILAGRGVTSVDTSIDESSSGRTTLLIRLHSPLPDTTIPEDDRIPSISLPYSLLVRALLQRDLGWLATEF
ncbi:MAG: hypothetical protein ABI835_11840 [Chloroflexota bacterium]